MPWNDETTKMRMIERVRGSEGFCAVVSMIGCEGYAHYCTYKVRPERIEPNTGLTSEELKQIEHTYEGWMHKFPHLEPICMERHEKRLQRMPPNEMRAWKAQNAIDFMKEIPVKEWSV